MKKMLCVLFVLCLLCACGRGQEELPAEEIIHPVQEEVQNEAEKAPEETESEKRENAEEQPEDEQIPDPVVPVTVRNLFSGEEGTITNNEHIRIFSNLLFADLCNTGATADCLNNCEISINDRVFHYHSDCGTFNDNANQSSISVDERTREEINHILEEYISLSAEESPAPIPIVPSDSTLVETPAETPVVEKPNPIRGESRGFWEIREDIQANATAFKETNPDTVGWLYLYETTIDSPVFQRAGDNDYYLTHNDYQQEDKNGALVADFENKFSGRDTQSRNLVLYGHSKDENPDGGVESSREYEHFTEIKRYQREDYCERNPYFLFASPEESMVFEVFAAFHTKTDFVYNLPNASIFQQKVILEEALKKSLFDFGVEVSPQDKIMTLSTCCRRIVPTYPNGYRFVVMGRLVEKGKLLEYNRDISENPTALTPNNVYE